MQKGKRQNSLTLTNKLKQFKDFDPDWNEASNHGLASKIGYSTT